MSQSTQHTFTENMYLCDPSALYGLLAEQEILPLELGRWTISPLLDAWEQWEACTMWIGEEPTNDQWEPGGEVTCEGEAIVFLRGSAVDEPEEAWEHIYSQMMDATFSVHSISSTKDALVFSIDGGTWTIDYAKNEHGRIHAIRLERN